MIQVSEARLVEVRESALKSGSHDTSSGEMCVMEAVAYVAGEVWSDSPACACPVIAAFLRRWNDDLGDESRTRLLVPLVPRLVGSKSTPAVELRRGYMALDWMVRVMTPAWLELAGLKESAGLLRDLAELHDQASSEAAVSHVRSAGAAAGAAAWDAAWAAAWDAARVAAWAAAWDAARVAAGDAAWDAARVAAGDALKPTVEQLQQLALDLVDRMLLAGENAK